MSLDAKLEECRIEGINEIISSVPEDQLSDALSAFHMYLLLAGNKDEDTYYNARQAAIVFADSYPKQLQVLKSIDQYLSDEAIADYHQVTSGLLLEVCNLVKSIVKTEESLPEELRDGYKDIVKLVKTHKGLEDIELICSHYRSEGYDLTRILLKVACDDGTQMKFQSILNLSLVDIVRKIDPTKQEVFIDLHNALDGIYPWHLADYVKKIGVDELHGLYNKVKDDKSDRNSKDLIYLAHIIEPSLKDEFIDHPSGPTEYELRRAAIALQLDDITDIRQLSHDTYGTLCETYRHQKDALAQGLIDAINAGCLEEYVEFMESNPLHGGPVYGGGNYERLACQM